MLFRSPYAATPTSCTAINANGTISETNLNGTTLAISNLQSLGVSYIVGEKVNMVDTNNIDQSANGTVAYANDSTIILSDVLGTFTSSLYARGSSSLQKATINTVTSNPSLIVTDPVGTFLVGQKVYFRTGAGADVANATLFSYYSTPNDLTEYVVSPKVSITGDGANALAYSVVNATSNSVESIVVLNTGSDYSYANIEIIANSTYGSGATAEPTISPMHGHGYDIDQELGARYAGISVTFDTIATESYKFPGYGDYRIVGIIQDPLYDDLTVNLNTFDHSKLTIANRVNTFTPGEIVIQPYSNAAGIVVFSNSTFLELENVRGTFINAVASDNVYGLSSTATANVTVANTSYFRIVGSEVESVSEVTSGGTGSIEQIVSNTQIRLTDVSGDFQIGDTLVDASTNSYANVVSLYTANGTTDVSSVFGLKFNQTARIPLISNTAAFTQYESVTQSVTETTGMVIDTTHEVDMHYTGISGGSFAVGQALLSPTANAYITYANSTYLRLTSANGVFAAGQAINSGSVSATSGNVYSVLVISNVLGTYQFQASNTITGDTSGAQGTPSAYANTLFHPDFIRNSGTVTYIENVEPFTRSRTSREKINITIKF